MKIGIITFQDAYNYGAVLQAYALRNKLGSKAEIINYQNDYFKNTNHYFIEESNILKRIIRRIKIHDLKVRTDKFCEFVDTLLLSNREPVCVEELENQYDAFVVGSDQVWNLECTGNDTTYYLDFVKTKKMYSYAASFGKTKLSDKEISLIKSKIVDYTYVSVREESAKDILISNGLKDVVVVLDPTLLLTATEWRKIFAPKKIKDRYIFVYNVTGDIGILKYAKRIAKKRGLKVYYITASIKPVFNVKMIMDAGPREWLNYIMQSEMVITNSYHGCIFSMIFHKNFRIFFSNNNLKNSTRIEDLLEKVGMKDIISYNSVQENRKVDIDYKEIDSILDKLRNQSNKFIELIKEDN